MNDQRSGYLLALGSAALGATYFCTGAYLVKPLTGVSVREFTATLYLWATLFGFLAVLPEKQRSRLRLSQSQVGWVVLLGALFGASVVLAFEAVRSLDPTSAATLGRTSVLFSLLLAYFILGERLSAVESIGALLILGGLAGTFGLKVGLGTAPVVMALGSALATALYQLVAKRTMTKVPPLVVNAYRNLAVLILLHLLSVGAARKDPPEGTYGLIVFAAFIGPFLHSQLNLMALARLDMMKASLLAQTHPLFVMLITGLWMSTWPGGRELATDLVLLAGILILIAGGAWKRRGMPVAPTSRGSPFR